MHLPSQILDLAETGGVDPALFRRWCEAMGSTVLAASDSLAKQIGLDYLAGRLDHVYCDRVMNSIMAAVTSPEFFEGSDKAVPEFTLKVYLAFDAGEYVRPTDKPQENPETKYTQPMLRLLLKSAAHAD